MPPKMPPAVTRPQHISFPRPRSADKLDALVLSGVADSVLHEDFENQS
jgi:hypothetical protein